MPPECDKNIGPCGSYCSLTITITGNNSPWKLLASEHCYANVSAK